MFNFRVWERKKLNSKFLAGFLIYKLYSHWHHYCLALFFPFLTLPCLTEIFFKRPFYFLLRPLDIIWRKDDEFSRLWSMRTILEMIWKKRVSLIFTCLFLLIRHTYHSDFMLYEVVKSNMLLAVESEEKNQLLLNYAAFA